MKHLSKIQANIIKSPLLDIVINLNGKLKKKEAVVDTGFDGYLSINHDLAGVLELKPVSKVRTINADNQVVLNYVYAVQIMMGSLEMDSIDYRVLAIGKVNQVDEIIIGQSMLDRFCQDNKVALVLDYSNSEIFFEG